MIHYYQQLGIRPGASVSEIKRAYRTLARRYHPDVNVTPDAQQRFLDITEAYHYLLNDQPTVITEPVPDTLAYETLYQHHHYRRRQSPPSPQQTPPPDAPVPPLLHFAMTGLVWGMSLFFILVPFYVCYQLINKGVDGWPSLAFFPLVIGGVCGVYQSARSGKRLLR